jgi:hypothetical protein
MGGDPRPLTLLPTVATPGERLQDSHDSASEAAVDATAVRAPTPSPSLTARLRGLAVDASVRDLLASAPLLIVERRTPSRPGERAARPPQRPRPPAARPLSLEPVPRPGTRHAAVQTDEDAAMGVKRRAPLSPLQAPATASPDDDDASGAAKPAPAPSSLEPAPESPLPALSPGPEPAAPGDDPAKAYRVLLARVNAARAARAAAGPPVLATVASMSQAGEGSAPGEAEAPAALLPPPASPARPRALAWASPSPTRAARPAPPPSPSSCPPRSQAPAPPVAAPPGGVSAVWQPFARQQAAAEWADAVAALASTGQTDAGDAANGGARPDPVKLFCVEQPRARAPGEFYRSFLAAAYPALLARYFPPPVPQSTSASAATTPARPPARHLYEVLREGRPVHAYFDLEFCRPANPSADGDAMVDAVVAAFLAEAAPLAGAAAVAGAEVFEADSSTDAKFSRHLVIRLPGVAWASTSAVGALAHALLSRDSASSLAVLKPPPRNAPPGAPHTRDWIVDTAVYTKNRHFRVLWSSKGGKAAVLAPTGRHAFGPGGAADRRSTPLATMFLASLAANVAPGTKMIDAAAGGGGGGLGAPRRPLLARRSVALGHPTRPRDSIKFEWKVDEEDVSDRRHSPPADVAAAAVAAAAWVEATAAARSASQPGAPPGAGQPVADHTALVRSVTVCGLGGALVAYGLAGEREGGEGERERRREGRGGAPPQVAGAETRRETTPAPPHPFQAKAALTTASTRATTTRPTTSTSCSTCPPARGRRNATTPTARGRRPGGGSCRRACPGCGAASERGGDGTANETTRRGLGRAFPSLSLSSRSCPVSRILKPCHAVPVVLGGPGGVGCRRLRPFARKVG